MSTMGKENGAQATEESQEALLLSEESFIENALEKSAQELAQKTEDIPESIQVMEAEVGKVINFAQVVEQRRTRKN